MFRFFGERSFHFLLDEAIGHARYSFKTQLALLVWSPGHVVSAIRTAEITGDKVNRGGGYCLEVPCSYRLYGPRANIERAEKMLAGDKKKTRMRLGSSSDLPEV